MHTPRRQRVLQRAHARQITHVRVHTIPFCRHALRVRRAFLHALFRVFELVGLTRKIVASKRTTLERRHPVPCEVEAVVGHLLLALAKPPRARQLFLCLALRFAELCAFVVVVRVLGVVVRVRFILGRRGRSLGCQQSNDVA